MTLDELIAALLAGDERLVAALCVALDGRVHAGMSDALAAMPDDPEEAQQERLEPLRETAARAVDEATI